MSVLPEAMRKRVGRAVSRLKEANHMAAEERWDVAYTMLWKAVDDLSELLVDIEEHAPGGDMETRISNREQRHGEASMRSRVVAALVEAGWPEAAEVARGVDVSRKSRNERARPGGTG